jgi:hypothetical protein
MESAAPPLVGFNNNVRYRGMRFHIQTEDSGVTKPHIITHLFADGGYVIKSVRTDYSEHLDRPDRPTLIQRLMREQHRAMALDLRDGRLDETINRLVQSSTPPEAVDSIPPEAERISVVTADDPDAEPESTRCAPQESLPETPPAAPRTPEPEAAREKPPEPAAAAPVEVKPQAAPAKASSRPERQRRSAPPAKAKRSRGRPSAALPMKPNAESIFGTAPQESLDEVILSYVTTAKNGPPSRGSK